jgi:hypothetical protein
VPRSAPLTHFYATNLPDLGDVVLSVTRYLDAAQMAPRRMELRAFRAAASRRAALPRLEPEDLLVADGGLAYVDVDLRGSGERFPFDDPRARVARVRELRFAGITSEERASHIGTGLAEWLRVTLECELLHSSFYEVTGEATAVRPPLGELPEPGTPEATEDFDGWAAEWLSSHEYLVVHEAPASFSKVLIASLRTSPSNDHPHLHHHDEHGHGGHEHDHHHEGDA